jgi:hypothetical protein
MQSKTNAAPNLFSCPGKWPRRISAILLLIASLLPVEVASADDSALIVGKVLTRKIVVLPYGPTTSGTLNIVYTVRVISSYPRRIHSNKIITIQGTRTVGALINPTGGPCLEPVMSKGARFVAEVLPIKSNRRYKFACPTLLPNGMALPFPVVPNEIPAVKEGLRVWAEAEKSGFNVGSPYPNILPLAQARQLMKSHNYYVWALGVSSYCAGANANTIWPLISHYVWGSPFLPVPLRIPGGTTRQIFCHDIRMISVRRAAWLVYAMTTYPPRRRNRITAHYAALLIASVLYYRRTAFGKDFLPAWRAVWANPVRASQKRRHPRLPKWATKVTYSASVAGFLKSSNRSRAINYEISKK